MIDKFQRNFKLITEKIITLQIFFTAYAVYVLVIDISEDLDAPLELSKGDSLVVSILQN